MSTEKEFYDSNRMIAEMCVFAEKYGLLGFMTALPTVIHLVLGLLITDEAQPLRACKYCNRAFIAKHPKAEYCKPACKNKHNVYKRRSKE